MVQKGKPSRAKGTAERNSKGGLRIPLDTRQQAEEVARWVEQLFASYPEQIAREVDYLRTHPDDKDSKARLPWLRNALATAGMIAYYLRTHRVRGPLE
jgi:hypothetical protein